MALNRRDLLRKVPLGGAAALLGSMQSVKAHAASGVGDGHGLQIVDRDERDARMRFFRFRTAHIGWQPGVNVLLPDGYDRDDRRYPVLFLLHGGDTDFISWDRFHRIRALTAGRPLIIVMPDGGRAGWYSNPVRSFAGQHNWESFHIEQLVPWVDSNFRTLSGQHGRAVAGFSMGGFGALKYTAKYPQLFASVSSYSGPASIRRDFGLVVHWANISSAAVELGGGTIYGAPFWDQGRVSRDNPVEQVELYRGKRIFLVAGSSPSLFSLPDVLQESQVLAGHREFRSLLSRRQIPFEAHEAPGGHVFRPDLFARDLDTLIPYLRRQA